MATPILLKHDMTRQNVVNHCCYRRRPVSTIKEPIHHSGICKQATVSCHGTHPKRGMVRTGRVHSRTINQNSERRSVSSHEEEQGRALRSVSRATAGVPCGVRGASLTAFWPRAQGGADRRTATVGRSAIRHGVRHSRLPVFTQDRRSPARPPRLAATQAVSRVSWKIRSTSRTRVAYCTRGVLCKLI